MRKDISCSRELYWPLVLLAVSTANPAYADNWVSVSGVDTLHELVTGNGHGYFRSSPWASSDVLMSIYYGLTPEQRGLVEQEDLPIFTFPPDYISRLWSAIETVDPEFAEDFRQLKASQASDDTP